jgi:hypothetical protein
MAKPAIAHNFRLKPKASIKQRVHEAPVSSRSLGRVQRGGSGSVHNVHRPKPSLTSAAYDAASVYCLVVPPAKKERCKKMRLKHSVHATELRIACYKGERAELN